MLLHFASDFKFILTVISVYSTSTLFQVLMSKDYVLIKGYPGTGVLVG